ncbi:MAG: hypothetical protein FJ288_06445 [Planctomycetes bacterium]|nr:hypothetical protein [Planctomycetota bacterium]
MIIRFLRLAAAAALLAACGADAACGAEARAADAQAFVRTSPRDPRYFELSDGRPYIPIGLNMVGPPSPDKGFAGMEEWLKNLSANRGNFVRVWLSSPYFDIENKRSGQYEEGQARHIDELLAAARRHNIRLKLCLEHFRVFDGTSWANKPLHLVANGGPAESVADFFDGRRSRDQFKRKLAWFAARCGSDPVVFGWELWNEVNCVKGGDVFAWTEIMLAELHRLFPRNLCMQSLGSHDGDWSRRYYPRMMVLPGNDVAQVHRYLDTGAGYKVCHGPVDVLAADAVAEIQKLSPGRPILLAESGAVEPRHSGPFKLYAKDADGIILHDVLFAPFFCGAAGPGHIWHWDHYVAKNNLWRHFARFAAVVEGVDPPAESFAAADLPHEALRVRALRGRRTFLAWLRDTENTWQAELAEGKPPRRIAGQSLRLPDGLATDGAAVRTYDPWQDRWAPARVEQGRVALPEFSRSLVVRIDLMK